MNRLIPPHSLIGMVHLGALPGTPHARKPLSEIIAQAKAEAIILAECGFDAILLENMHDRPYLKGAVGPEIIAAMTAVAAEVRKTVALPLGLQVLAAANREALAVALAADCDFVRVEGFVFGHVADEGYIDGCAANLLRYRRHLGAEGIQIWADIKKKHSAHAITADVDLSETARAAEFFSADAVIITGIRTGGEASLTDVIAVKAAVSLPVLVGSGVTEENVRAFLRNADGVIIGSSLKETGHWTAPVDPERCRRLIAAAKTPH